MKISKPLTMTRICSYLVVLVLGFAGVAGAHETGVKHEEPSVATPAVSNAKERIRAKYSTDLTAARAAKEAYRALKRTESAQKQLAAVKTYGRKMFEVRQKVLADYPNRQRGKQCADADNQTINTSVAASQTILRSALANLDAATEVAAAKLIVKSAIEQTRVFAVFAPAANGLCRSSRLTAQIDLRLTKAINVLKVAGEQVESLTGHLTQARTEAMAAHNIYQELVAAPNYPDTAPAKAKFAQAKSHLDRAKDQLTAFKNALSALKQTLDAKSKLPPRNEKTEVVP